MFLNNKYTKIYYSIINNAKSQERKKLNRENKNFLYYEKHHIIPKSLGGFENKENLVLLTAKEHFICHLLLCKMLEGKYKNYMVSALIKMAFCKSNKQQRYTSNSYSLIKKLIAKKNSELFKGKPKSLNTKQKMSKGKIGIKFSENHKKNLSLAQIKRNLKGNNNPFFGKTHSKELKEKIGKLTTKRLKGNQIAKGRIWINNGIISKMVYPDIEIFDNWKKGRIKWKN